MAAVKTEVVRLGEKQIELLYTTLHMIRRGVQAGNLDENWMGDNPAEIARFKKLEERFKDLTESY